MGNLEGHGHGPLTQQQIDRMAQMGRRIVSRMEQLGMGPPHKASGLCGVLFLRDFARTCRWGLKLIPQGIWVNFKRPWVVDPLRGFSKLAADWYKALRKVYGISGKMFGGDLFHEGGSKGDINVTRAAQAVQGAMQKASPGSSWVIQAWGNPSRELLAGTDPRHALVLQLTKDMADGGKNLRVALLTAFPGSGASWPTSAAIRDYTAGFPFCPGWGVIWPATGTRAWWEWAPCPKWLETNPCITPSSATVYGRRRIFPVRDWLKKYARQRYGAAPESSRAGFGNLSSSIYNPARSQEGCTESIRGITIWETSLKRPAVI